MAANVLVPLDGSQQSWSAFDHARRQFQDGTLTLLHVIDPVEAGFSPEVTAFGQAEDWHERATEEAEALFEEARERAAEEPPEGGVPTIESVVEHGRPARTIVQYAREHDVDHVVMGSHGRSGVSRILLGSVAETVVRRSPVPVTVAR